MDVFNKTLHLLLIGHLTAGCRDATMSMQRVSSRLIHFVNDKSLSLVMRDAADNGQRALEILRDYYQGKGKPLIISLYTELT